MASLAPTVDAERGNCVKPVLQALILARMADRLADGSWVIHGTFNTVEVELPSPRSDESAEEKRFLVGGQHGSPYAYISLTDVVNDTRLSLQFVSLKKNKVIFSKDVVITCEDRLATVEFVAPLPHLAVSQPGAYSFEIVCDGEIVGSSRLLAVIRSNGSDTVKEQDNVD